MKRIKLIARQKIMNYVTKSIHEDEGLRALGGYYEKVYEVKDDYNQEMFLSYFEDEHPEYRGWCYEIMELE